MIYGSIHGSDPNPYPNRRVMKGGRPFSRVFPGAPAPDMLLLFSKYSAKKRSKSIIRKTRRVTHIFAQLEDAFVRRSHVCDKIVIYFKACQRDGTSTTFRAYTHSASNRISSPPFSPHPDIDIDVTPWSSTEEVIAWQPNCGGHRLVA